jgi:hypothetical protein
VNQRDLGRKAREGTEGKVKISAMLTRVLAALALIGLVLAAYFVLARPYQLHWGATAEEIKRAMPGDELNSDPKFLATRAITINGTPEAIWPWLIQMGFGRAGYYGYDILENLGSPRGSNSAENILPEFQNFKVGDEVPISGVAKMYFYAIQPNEYLIWYGLTGGTYGAFTWALYPIDSAHTRLVSRIRWSYHWTQPGILALDLFSEFSDHIAVREILQGVKGRVEGSSKSMAQANVEFAIYVISFLVFIAALIMILLRPLTWRGWLTGLLTGIAWLVVWYAPVPVWVGAALELLVLAALIRAFRPASPRKNVSQELDC